MAASNGSAGPREVGTDEATYRPDELVVSLPYHRLISERLTSWRAQPYLAPGDEDKRLALARLSVDATTAVRHLRQEKPDWVASAQASARARGHAPTELDVLLHCLRQAFQDEFSRWSPTMGKNRVVKRRVNGSYVIDGGGRRGPRPIRNYVLGQPRPGSWWRRPDSRKPVALRGVAPGSGTRVGVVDTRLSPHPWLAGGYVATADDLLSAEMEERQLIDHATFVTGLVLRQAPGTVVELRSGLDDEASQDSWTLAKTIARLAETTDVVNLSLGCVTEDGQPPLVLTAAIAALGPHTVVVAAAGNHGTQDGYAAPVWPAALDNVIAVGALDGSRPAEFSPEAPWVDALAPGVDVASTCDVSRRGKALFATWSGTSFAAAAVSGAIAAKIRDGRTPQEAWQRLQQKSDKDARGRVLVPLRTLSDWPPDRAS